MHAANSHPRRRGGSLERPGREGVFAPKARPQLRHGRRWAPEPSRPFRTKEGRPHPGRRSGSPRAEAARPSAMALRSASASSRFSASAIVATWSTIPMAGPFPDAFRQSHRRRKGPCQSWSNSGIAEFQAIFASCERPGPQRSIVRSIGRRRPGTMSAFSCALFADNARKRLNRSQNEKIACRIAIRVPEGGNDPETQERPGPAGAFSCGEGRRAT